MVLLISKEPQKHSVPESISTTMQTVFLYLLHILENAEREPEQALKQMLKSKNNTEHKDLVLQIGAGSAKH